jgi:hypothetical protein
VHDQTLFGRRAPNLPVIMRDCSLHGTGLRATVHDQTLLANSIVAVGHPNLPVIMRGCSLHGAGLRAMVHDHG